MKNKKRAVFHIVELADRSRLNDPVAESAELIADSAN
jgi:hypothetical protein